MRILRRRRPTHTHNTTIIIFMNEKLLNGWSMYNAIWWSVTEKYYEKVSKERESVCKFPKNIVVCSLTTLHHHHFLSDDIICYKNPEFIGVALHHIVVVVVLLVCIYTGAWTLNIIKNDLQKVCNNKDDMRCIKI